MPKQTRILWITLAVLAAVMLGAWLFLRPAAVPGTKRITVTVQHGDGTERSFELTTAQEYLRGALDEAVLASGRETQYGLYVLTVDGETADEAQKQWWGYTVNGTEASFGVSEQPIADGDGIVFSLHEDR